MGFLFMAEIVAVCVVPMCCYVFIRLPLRSMPHPLSLVILPAMHKKLLTQRYIFWFWLPMFASWLLMTAEGPLISAFTNRLPNEVIMLAAQGIVISLAVTIESPIINLLATSTALVKDRASYLLMRRFTIHWMIGLTIISVLIAFTPLFDLVVLQALGTPPEVAEWVKPGLQIMIFWSAAIAWRRFLQGVLIHFGHTRKMAWGTGIRLAVSAIVVISLFFWGPWAAVINAAWTWMAGVVAEAIYITAVTRPLIAENFYEGSPAAAETLTYKALFWFHLPLAATSLLILMAQPMVTFSLNRLPNPTLSLAAWPVLFQIMLISRAAAFALPEAVIALSDGLRTFPSLRRFAVLMAGGLTVWMTLLVFTPLADFYVFTVQDMTAVTGNLVVSVLPLFLLFPAMAAGASWLRGLLINNKTTTAVNWGMGLNLFITAVVLAIGLTLRTDGLATAAVALNLAALFELIYLGWRMQRILPPTHNLVKRWAMV